MDIDTMHIIAMLLLIGALIASVVHMYLHGSK
jgi:cbb3-type cytochrome oxidase subunit 3